MHLARACVIMACPTRVLLPKATSPLNARHSLTCHVPLTRSSRPLACFSAYRLAQHTQADACFDDAAPLMALPFTTARFLVGATISDGFVKGAVASGWMRAPQRADGEGKVTAWSDAVGSWGTNGAGEGGKEAPMEVPPSVVHRAAVADADGTRLVLLSRLMRADLQARRPPVCRVAGHYSLAGGDWW